MNRKHPNESPAWRKSEYWRRLNLDWKEEWVFGDKKTGYYLLKFR
jgi:RNA-directed DNA polymerase